jgi:hypothetical protein
LQLVSQRVGTWLYSTILTNRIEACTFLEWSRSFPRKIPCRRFKCFVVPVSHAKFTSFGSCCAY